MSAKRLTERKLIENISYMLHYDRIEMRGSGYAFDCNKDGTLRSMTKAGAANLIYCQEHPAEYHPPHVEEYVHSYWEPATAQCRCGHVITLDGDAPCGSCGQWHNAFGQELRPPREWGEETGERFDDNGNYIGGGDDDC